MSTCLRSGKRITYDGRYQGRVQKDNSTLPGQKKRKKRKNTTTRAAQKSSQRIQSEKKLSEITELGEDSLLASPSRQRHFTRSLKVICRDDGSDREQKFPGQIAPVTKHRRLQKVLGLKRPGPESSGAATRYSLTPIWNESFQNVTFQKPCFNVVHFTD